MIICCLTTTRIKGYLFKIPLQGQPASVVLSDQVRSLDWRARPAKFKGNVTRIELKAVRERVRLLVG
ncbi:type II toxin-antitoxin system PemK/MazF family toxin [Gluconobacter frateurii]|uniref:type II toxin-antitoxin system PemK/MazF family toxin n=1 Tax=Gluconobacter frateurii TaxID=38308 RepID=UPI001F05A500|nr:type II toxin-antitoxin system PemK/MazF family toxin [Gluconobacter frateurii]